MKLKKDFKTVLFFLNLCVLLTNSVVFHELIIIIINTKIAVAQTLNANSLQCPNLEHIQQGIKAKE